jgi:hypothetical protein
MTLEFSSSLQEMANVTIFNLIQIREFAKYGHPDDTRGGLQCLGGVSTSCQLFAPAVPVSPNSRSGQQNRSQPNSAFQGQDC